MNGDIKVIKFETKKAKRDLMNYIKREGFLRIEGLSFFTDEGEVDVDIDFGKYPIEWTEVDAAVYEMAYYD